MQAAKFIRISVCVCETKRHRELVSEVDGGVGAREGESEYLGVLYTWLVSVSLSNEPTLTRDRTSSIIKE